MKNGVEDSKSGLNMSDGVNNDTDRCKELQSCIEITKLERDKAQAEVERLNKISKNQKKLLLKVARTKSDLKARVRELEKEKQGVVRFYECDKYDQNKIVKKSKEFLYNKYHKLQTAHESLLGVCREVVKLLSTLNTNLDVDGITRKLSYEWYCDAVDMHDKLKQEIGE